MFKCAKLANPPLKVNIKCDIIVSGLANKGGNMKTKRYFIVFIAIMLCAFCASTKVEANQDTDMEKYKEKPNVIATKIRDNTIKRNQSFTIYAKIVSDKPVNSNSFYEFADKLVDKAMSENLAKSSSAGDYLRYSWDRYNTYISGFSLYQEEKYNYYLTINYKFYYYTTYNQEKTLDADIAKFIKKNIDKKDTDYKKICKIYEYITTKVTYDSKNKGNNISPLKYTAYGAFEKKTALCQGYATLLYKMLKEANIDDVRVVRSSTHAWNIVKLGNKYYNLDSTWDSSYKKKNKGTNKYFLKGSKDFNISNTHILDKEFKTKDFQKKYPISNNDYNSNKVTILKLKANSRKKITIKWKMKKNCDGYIIEYSTDKRFKNSKSIKIKNNNTTKKSIKYLKRNKKYYVRIRAYHNISGNKYYSSWSTIKCITTKR